MPPAGKVLVVEDDWTHIDIIRENLGSSGYEVVVAEDNAAGWKAFQAAKPDAVIVDFELPDGNSVALIAKIRAAGKTPVILLTGRTTTGVKRAGLRAGADHYLSKPAQFSEVGFWIDSLLKRNRTGEAGVSLETGELIVDPEARKAHVGDDKVSSLSGVAFEVLYRLVRASPGPVAQAELFKGLTASQDPAELRRLMAELRRILGPNGERIIRVEDGYRFE